MTEETQVDSAASAEPTEAVQTETAVERPEWLPEKFKSAEIWQMPTLLLRES